MDFINPQNRILKDSIRYTNNYEPVARIVVIGVGGAGNNALNRMIDDGVVGVEYVAVNTDVQDLKLCKADRKIAIGEKVTGGRGCGAMPELGESAANESKEAIRQILREDENQRKADMVFITCGMGGGTGTGAAPVIASIAKEEGILTVAVVTKPFRFEGKVRMAKALVGIDKITPNVDTMITIANDKLLNIVDVNDGFKEAFEKADEILKQSIRGITDLINLPALVNLDFADVSTVMRGKGLAHIAIGEGTGENKVMTAINKAMSSDLLDTNIEGATDLIICISGKVSLIDVDAAMREIEPKLSQNVNIIFGAREDEDLKDNVSVTIIATGIKDRANRFSSINPRLNQAQAFNMEQQGFNPNLYGANNQFGGSYASRPSFDQGVEPRVSRLDPTNEFSLDRNMGADNTEKTNTNLNTDNSMLGGNVKKDNSILNVDLSKIGYKNSGDTKDILRSFVDNKK